MSKRHKAPSSVDYGDHHREAVDAMIIQQWLANPKLKQKEVADRINRSAGTKINADTVEGAIKRARKRGWLDFILPREEELAHLVYRKARIKRDEATLHVLNSDDAEHIARAIAAHLKVQIVKDLKDKTAIHIGFFGGRTNSFVAKHLVELLRKEAECRLRAKKDQKTGGKADYGDHQLVLHSLVGVLDSNDPETDPNSFPMYFMQHRDLIERSLGRKLQFRKLTMPGVVTNEEFEVYREQSLAIRHAFENKPEFDMIIASCGHAGHEYTLTQYVEASLHGNEELLHKLNLMKEYFKKEGVLGDVAWHPILPNGMPVDFTASHLRVATLFTLPELKQLVAKNGGTHVILAVGPCSQQDCPYSKSDLFRWIIQQRPMLARHIFVDRRTAEDFLAEEKGLGSEA